MKLNHQQSFWIIFAALLPAALLTGCAVLSKSTPLPTKEERTLPPQALVITASPTEILPGSPIPTAFAITEVVTPGQTVAPLNPPAGSGSLVVTLDNINQSITMRTGDRLLLKLGEIYNWEVTTSDPDVLSRVINIMVIRGAQGLYEAHKPGQVELNAVGDPLCRSSKPACMMPSLLFKISVIVK
jgi:hypothetical protein